MLLFRFVRRVISRTVSATRYAGARNSTSRRAISQTVSATRYARRCSQLDVTQCNQSYGQRYEVRTQVLAARRHAMQSVKRSALRGAQVLATRRHAMQSVKRSALRGAQVLATRRRAVQSVERSALRGAQVLATRRHAMQSIPEINKSTIRC